MPDVYPTWTLEREEVCRFDGYHLRVHVDLNAITSGLVRVEAGYDDLRGYAAIRTAEVGDVELGVGNTAQCFTTQFSDVTDTVRWSQQQCLPELPECKPPVSDDLSLRYCAGRPRVVRIAATFPDAERFGRVRIVEHLRTPDSYFPAGVVEKDLPIEGQDHFEYDYWPWNLESLDVELLDWRGRVVTSATLPAETEPELCDGPLADSGLQDTGGAEPTDGSEPEPRRCGCATATSSGAWWVVGLSVVWTRRRRGATTVRRENT
ncbi:MAG: hypothetical protein H6735_32685 [Alphaproteobacteria bacterium]|nr:hypothetical protein [Alphaproteobacteria bacterium]